MHRAALHSAGKQIKNTEIIHNEDKCMNYVSKTKNNKQNK